MKLFAVVLTLFALLVAAPAAAQESAPLDQPQAAASIEAPSLWQRWLALVRDQQRDLHRQLAGAIRTLKNEGSPVAVWSLILLSFLYGVFHAAGPGHGKAVISAYLLSHESAIKRGIWLASAAALVQGLTAIALVELLVVLLGFARRDAQSAVGPLESLSFGLIALLGAWLTWRGVRALWRRRPVSGPADRDRGACAHNHVPSPDQLQRPLSWRGAAGIVLSIGIRPCSGAVLVLIFAEAVGLRLAGIAAVLAMSLGTALTVSLLALLAVSSRRLAASLVRAEAGRMALFGQGVAVLGGLAIMTLGLSLFLGSLGPGHPLL
ncbi:MAG: nickel/cobalt transporter [Pseudomonadota bacterium]